MSSMSYLTKTNFTNKHWTTYMKYHLVSSEKNLKKEYALTIISTILRRLMGEEITKYLLLRSIRHSHIYNKKSV
jgi:hypothetical protein